MSHLIDYWRCGTGPIPQNTIQKSMKDNEHILCHCFLKHNQALRTTSVGDCLNCEKTYSVQFKKQKQKKNTWYLDLGR